MTGARGRLGRALVTELAIQCREVVGWSRPDYDLEDPDSPARLISRDQPSLVFHTAAWTDVDGAALDPVLAQRLNGQATADLARACAAARASVVYVSTNAVFDGRRDDGRGYAETDAPAPANAYGDSKLMGERAILESGGQAWIARISWLFGAPGADFPEKVVTAVDQLGAAEALPMVADETGRPTYSLDLAAALADLPTRAPPGIYHLANAGQATRYEWAERVLAKCRPTALLRAVSQANYERAAAVPRWAVLDTSRADELGLVMRPWTEALDEYLDESCAPI